MDAVSKTRLDDGRCGDKEDEDADIRTHTHRTHAIRGAGFAEDSTRLSYIGLPSQPAKEHSAAAAAVARFVCVRASTRAARTFTCGFSMGAELWNGCALGVG